MKANFTHIIEQKGALLARVVVLLSVVFIWILIDVGNVYGQSMNKDQEMVRALDGNPMLREGVNPGYEMDESNKEEGFEILPNPTRGSMVFDFEFIIRTGDEETSVDVFDSMGRLAVHVDLDPQTIETGLKLDLSRELPGTYIAVVRNGDNVFTKRILKI